MIRDTEHHSAHDQQSTEHSTGTAEQQGSTGDSTAVGTAEPRQYQYELKPGDLRTAYRKGRERDSNGFNGTVDIDSTNAHIIGLKGEIAFAQLFDLDPDLTYNSTGGDSVRDFTVEIDGAGNTINVKLSTYYNDPWLKVRAERVENGADVYVLGAISDDGVRVRFVGWATHDMVASKPVTCRTGSENHVLEPGELHAMSELGTVTARDTTARRDRDDEAAVTVREPVTDGGADRWVRADGQ